MSFHQNPGWWFKTNTKVTFLKKTPTPFGKKKMVELGGDYLLWSNSPENPSLN